MIELLKKDDCLLLEDDEKPAAIQKLFDEAWNAEKAEHRQESEALPFRDVVSYNLIFSYYSGEQVL